MQEDICVGVVGDISVITAWWLLWLLVCLSVLCPCRLRQAVNVAAPGSMDRHNRRVAVLEVCR